MSVLVIAGAVGNGAGLLFGQGEGILALIAPPIIEPQAPLDETSTLLVSEGGTATDASVVAIVLTARTLFDAAIQLLGIVVSVHALDAGTILVHLFTELVLRDTGSVRLEDVIWVAFETFPCLGEEAVR